MTVTVHKMMLCQCGIFLVLLIAFSKSLYKTLYGGNAGAILLLLLGIFFIMAAQISHWSFSLKVTRFSILWVIAFGVAVSNNYDLKYGNSLSVIQLVIGTLLVLLLQSNDRWCAGAAAMMKRFTMFYLVTGFLLLFMRDFQSRYIVPLFHLEASNEYYLSTLLRQINNGYMTGLTSHYSTMGMYLSIGMCFFAGNLYNEKGKVRKADLAGVLWMLAGILLSGKRSALLFPTLAVLLVYFLFFRPKNISRRYRYIAMMAIGLLCAAAAMMFVPRLGGTAGRILDAIGSRDLNDITNTRYEMLWLPAIKLFSESPLTGIGWGNFKYSFTKYYPFSVNQNNTHNVYLQLLCETGIVGTGIILGTMFASAWSAGRMLNNWRKGAVVIPRRQLSALGISLSMQVYFFLYSLTGNPMYDIQCYLPYMLSVAIGLSTVLDIKTNHQRQDTERQNENWDIDLPQGK